MYVLTRGRWHALRIMMTAGYNHMVTFFTTSPLLTEIPQILDKSNAKNPNAAVVIYLLAMVVTLVSRLQYLADP